jgi:predicted nucleotidyltransferase
VKALEFVATRLRERGVAFAMIGGAALNIRGISRNTFDRDLLVVDPAVLQESFWSPIPETLTLKAIRGDADDPLAGVVRVSGALPLPVDVVVGRYLWQQELLGRATPIVDDEVEIPCVGLGDLALLKLHAGGPQDLLDIVRILGAGDRRSLTEFVELHLSRLPAVARASWAKALALAQPGS